jgi:hypothetical protein
MAAEETQKNEKKKKKKREENESLSFTADDGGFVDPGKRYGIREVVVEEVTLPENGRYFILATIFLPR